MNFNDIAILIGKPEIKAPKKIAIQVAKLNIKRNLLAQVEVPINYAGVHGMVIDVYGEIEIENNRGMGGKSLADMRCEINGESVDNILPESLLQTIAEEILAGNYE